MTARKLRGWHGVKPVASPAGTAIITRLRTTPADDRVLDQVAEHLGRLRRADLAAISRLAPPGGHLDTHGRHQARKDQLNRRKRALTAGSSSRWAGAIYRGNDEQAKLARRNQKRHIASLHAAVTAIKTRLAQPTGDTLIRAQRAGRKQGCQPRGYATQAERYQKQRRLQALLAELRQVTADYDAGRVRVTEGGRRLARTRHNLDATGLTHDQWREQWNCARWLIQANGSSDETYGNLTITVTPAGRSRCGCPGRWSTWPTPGTAGMPWKTRPGSPTGPGNGPRGSPAASRSPTRSPASRVAAGFTSPPPGRSPARQPPRARPALPDRSSGLT